MMTAKFRIWCVVGLLCATTPVVAADSGSGTGLRFGSVAMNIPAEMHRRLTPLTDYLARETGEPVTLKLSPNMSAAIDDMATGAVDIAYLTPVAYLEAHARSGARLVAKTVTGGKSSFRLMIVVPDKSAIRSVSDLAGKTFAFGDKAAILQRAVVVGAGMPLEKLGAYRFIGHYDNIARGVHSGDFDAGILKDTIAAKWKSQGLRVLYASPELPPYNIAVGPRVSDRQFARLQAAFLKLNAGDPAQEKVVLALDKGYDGFASTSDAEYDVVRRLIAPFAEK
jgi:phosphonate transport system substrate-binding protein